MATWYAQTSAASFFAVSGGTTSSQWNAAANGSGAWLDLSADYTADTFNSNGKTTIAIDANVTAAELTSAGSAGTWLINTTGVTITANLVAGTTGTFLMDSGTPSVTIVGNVTGGSGAGDYCIVGTVAGTLAITGNVTGGGAADAYGIVWTTATASLTITGNVTAATAPALDIFRAGMGVTVVSGNIVDTATVSAILMYLGSLVYAPGPTNYYRMRTTGATTVDLSTSGGTAGGVYLTHSIGIGV